MSRKQIKLGVIVLAGLVVLYFVARLAVLDEAAKLDDDARVLRNELTELKRFNRKEAICQKKLKEFAAHTYGLDKDVASNTLHSRVMQMIQSGGMKETRQDSTTITGRAKRGSYQEIGRKYSLLGSMEQATNMLYLLEQDPYLHRIEGLIITPMPDRMNVKMDFRYMTLVLEKRTKSETLMTADPETLQPIAALAENPTRALYTGIAQRNLFRPYIQKRVLPPANPQPQPQPQPRPQQPQIDWQRYCVRDLSSYDTVKGKRQDIWIEDVQTRELKRYNPGDTIVGGTIVMVDYRTMPKPKQPDLVSHSRLVFRFGNDYYAVELGDTLADRHRLEGTRLPSSLRDAPSTAPAKSQKTRTIPAQAPAPPQTAAALARDKISK